VAKATVLRRMIMAINIQVTMDEDRIPHELIQLADTILAISTRFEVFIIQLCSTHITNACSLDVKNYSPRCRATRSPSFGPDRGPLVVV